MNRQRDVRWQRPRCGGPHQKRATLIVQPWRQEIDRRIAYVFVTLRNFMRAERGAAARAIRHALVAAIDQLFVRELLEDPPDTLDVIRAERDVRLGIIQPIADPLGETL